MQQTCYYESNCSYTDKLTETRNYRITSWLGDDMWLYCLVYAPENSGSRHWMVNTGLSYAPTVLLTSTRYAYDIVPRQFLSMNNECDLALMTCRFLRLWEM